MSSQNFGLLVQALGSEPDRVLVLSNSVATTSGQPWFAPSDIGRLCESLRIPRPSNVSRELVKLRDRKLAVRTQSGKWGLTPKGEQLAGTLAGSAGTPTTRKAAQAAPGSDFGHARHTVIPPSWAPVRFADPIGRLLAEFPFDSNVFCMTRFPNAPEDTSFLDPVRDAVNALREICDGHGLKLHLASDRQLDDDLLGNVVAHMWACRYGIGLLEDCAGRGLNYNVVTELGAMLMTGRRCALLKDPSAGALPADIAGQIYKPVSLDDITAVRDAAHQWLAADLGLGLCPAC